MCGLKVGDIFIDTGLKNTTNRGVVLEICEFDYIVQFLDSSNTNYRDLLDAELVLESVYHSPLYEALS